MVGVLAIAVFLGWLLYCFILTPPKEQTGIYYLSPYDEGWDDVLNSRAAGDVLAAIESAEQREDAGIEVASDAEAM